MINMNDQLGCFTLLSSRDFQWQSISNESSLQDLSCTTQSEMYRGREGVENDLWVGPNRAIFCKRNTGPRFEMNQINDKEKRLSQHMTQSDCVVFDRPTNDYRDKIYCLK